MAVPGVRVVPGSAASAAPDSQFGKLQQRVGELFGQAREGAEDKVPSASKDIRDVAQNRFTELSNKSRDAVGQQVHNLQDAASDFSSKLQDKTQELTGATKEAEQKLQDKVRRV